MFDLIIYIIAFFVTVPMIATWIVYKISVKIHNQKLKAFHNAVNWTTVLYIIAVTMLLTIIFNKQFLGVILVLLLTFLALIIFIQWKTNTEIVLKKALKIMWRTSFLLFMFLYICLILFGIIQRIFFY